MSTITDLGDRLAALSSADAAALRQFLKDRLGIEAVAVPAPPVVEPPPPAVPTAFDVALEAVDAARRVAVIRTIRELTSLGLAEARVLAEGYPKVALAGVDLDTAEKAKLRLEAAGATVAVRPA